MRELDEMLQHLRGEPAVLPTGLDDAVMAGLGRRRERQGVRRGLALASGVAMFVGVAGAVVPRASANADPLLAIPAAAPSHLLAD